MADEPNNEMDKLLRAYAEARRKGADLPLHPATRKMLQAEVARRFPQTERPAWSRLRAFWPQFAFGTGLCAILLVAVISLRQPRPPERNAQTPAAEAETSRRSEVLDEKTKKQNEAPSPKTEAMTRRDVATADSLAVQAQPVARQEERLPLEDAPVPLQREDDTPSASLRAPNAQPRVLQLQEGAPSRVPKEGTVRTYDFARASRLTNLGDALRLQFVSVSNTGQPPATQLLKSFQLEQQGDEVRITDTDGSIYLGQLFPQPPGEPQNVLGFGESAKALGATENSQGDSVQLLFAQGTNRTLAKPVRVEGRYLERTNPVKVITTTAAGRTATAPADRLERARHSIVGKAVVGQTNEVPLSAVSVEPGK